MLTSGAVAQVTSGATNPQQVDPGPPAHPGMATGTMSVLPPRPPGKSTVIGGAIQSIDPVRDQFTLKVFGGKPMKILFDERTQVYRDGKRTPLRDLRPNDHASVETILDGTKVFALSIHVLSRLPEGERDGQVLAYDAGTRELTVSDAMGNAPMKLLVPADLAIVHVGQAASSQAGGYSDLVKGTLVTIKFKSDGQGHGVATGIAILAAPGSTFVFSGNITFLDLRSRVFVVSDPSNDKSYKIDFDPTQLPESQNLHEGTNVTVSAIFDGASYKASAITINPVPPPAKN